MLGGQSEKKFSHAADDVVSDTLREIAEELASIEEIDAVMESEKDILNKRHKAEIANIRSRQRGEMEEMERNISMNKARQT